MGPATIYLSDDELLWLIVVKQLRMGVVKW